MFWISTEWYQTKGLAPIVHHMSKKCWPPVVMKSIMVIFGAQSEDMSYTWILQFFWYRGIMFSHGVAHWAIHFVAPSVIYKLFLMQPGNSKSPFPSAWSTMAQSATGRTGAARRFQKLAAAVKNALALCWVGCRHGFHSPKNTPMVRHQNYPIDWILFPFFITTSMQVHRQGWGRTWCWRPLRPTGSFHA